MKQGSLVDAVQTKEEGVLITKNGSPAAVPVSYSKSDGWKETMASRSNAALTREIKEGFKAVRADKSHLYSLKELFKD